VAVGSVAVVAENGVEIVEAAVESVVEVDIGIAVETGVVAVGIGTAQRQEWAPSVVPLFPCVVVTHPDLLRLDRKVQI